MIDPIAIWALRYPYEEAISVQQQLLDDLRQSVGSDLVIGKHVAEIAVIVDRLPASTKMLYQGWATLPGSYRFGAEAHYQKRLLHLLLRLYEGGFPIEDIREPICARQTIHPSGFNATPRIARLLGASFVIVPAPTTYWLYGISNMIADLANGHRHNGRKLSLYLRYLTAARSFERWATPLTAHSIDLLVDEIVHRGDVEDVDSSEAEPSNLAMNMVSSIEDFFLAHELAHLLLDHGANGSIEAEAAADRKALEMLRSLDHSRFGYFEVTGLGARHFPQLGYLSLRMWTAIRLAAEQRVLPWVYDTAAEVTARHQRISAVWDQRSKQAELVGILDTFEMPPILKQIAGAMSKLVEHINLVELDDGEATRIRQLSRSLAAEDYDELIARYRIKL